MRRNLILAVIGFGLGFILVLIWLVAGRGQPNPSPTLLFLQEVDGRANLWQVSPEGGQPQPLSDEPIGVWDYSASQDGRYLLLSSLDADESNDLVLLEVESGRRQRLLDCQEGQCRQGQWQPGGQRIAYERRPLDRPAAPPEVWLLDPANGRTWPAHPRELLAEAGFETLTSRYPRWSADGRYLAYFKPDAHLVVILDWQGGQPILIPANLNDVGGWSPTGYQLAYTELTFDSAAHAGEEEGKPHTDEGSGLVSHLVITDLVSQQTIDLASGLAADDGRPAWRPDGALLALPRAGGGGGRQLWTIQAGGGQATPLTDDPLINHSSLAWSPDGRYLAFMRLNLSSSDSEPAVWLYDSQTASFRLIQDRAFLPGWLPARQ